METLTRTQLKEDLKEVKDYIGERVGAVEDQVLRLNGRIQKHDRELAAHAERLRQMEDVEFVDLPEPTEAQVLTRRDLKIVAWTIVGLGTIIFGWQQALEVFLAYLKSALP